MQKGYIHFLVRVDPWSLNTEAETLPRMIDNSPESYDIRIIFLPSNIPTREYLVLMNGIKSASIARCVKVLIAMGANTDRPAVGV